ncbi:serine hydrolase domain-containing protein [Paenibacillus sp. E194]|uniref:serine hydrolase domain-containing protein n=1 Tax=Paenibacillus sp. E194 TaxID=1458845 RepID=UPI0005C949DB|nr:serine hydrolase domain-containing protein [Paenibacillus sp. E194]
MNTRNDRSAAYCGESASIQRFFNQIEQCELPVHSLIVCHHGSTIAEFWREPYRKDCPQLLYSLSKSVTSIAVGIAWDMGLIRLDESVISFFPERLPERVSDKLSAMTIHHLLSMTAGHKANIYPVVVNEQDWVKAFLAQEVDHEPGTQFQYSTHSTYMLSAILERITGQNLVDFLMPRLFEPLGIARPVWETCPMGVTAGGMGLSLTTNDVAAFGQMLLNKGIYQGRRIVSESYIEMATSEQSDNRKGANRIDWAQGYGYQFHRCRDGCFRADGAFGQLCFVSPKEGIVIAAAASYPTMDMLQTLLNLIYEHLLGEVDSSGDTREHRHESVEQKGDPLSINHTSRPPAEPCSRTVPLHREARHTVGRQHAHQVPELHQHVYVMQPNASGLKKVRFDAQGETLQLQLSYGDERDIALPINVAQPMRTKAVFHKDLSMPLQEVVVYASWVNECTLQAKLFYIETPYMVTYIMRFQPQSIELEFDINVSFHLSNYTAIGYRASI